MPTIIPVYDRSRVVTDWKCNRKRYLQYDFEGKGVVTGNTALELYMGTAVHDALSGIASMWKEDRQVDIDLIANTAHTQMIEALAPSEGDVESVESVEFANEQAALVEGLIRGFYKQVWPPLMAQYPYIVLIEQEMEYRHDGLLFMSKPDLVLENHDGELWYIEYKTTSSKKEEWVNSWNTAIQLHSTIRAIENTVGQKVAGVVVQGLYKGYQSYGKQGSPFCYAYYRSGNPPFTREELAYEFRAGFKRRPTWELPGGVAKWVDDMPSEVLANQFPQSPPIFIKDDMVESFFKQRASREWEIAQAKHDIATAESLAKAEYVINKVFPQNFAECVPGWGKPCSYRNICHGPAGADPLALGYTWREPHHAQETELQNDPTE